MKIALATNDRKNIALRTGRAKEFAIYTINNGRISEIAYKTNTHEHHHHDENEEHEHSHREIIDLIKDVDLLLVRAIGKHFKKDVEQAKIEYKKIDNEDIGTALKPYL